MFAVPGWAVSAASLVQERNKLKKSSTKNDFKDSDRPSKKRKYNDFTASAESTIVDNQPGHTSTRQKPNESKSVAASSKKKNQDVYGDNQGRTRGGQQDSRSSGHDKQISATTRRDSVSTKTESTQDPRAKIRKNGRQRSGDQTSPHTARSDTSETASRALASLPSSVPPTKLTPLQAKMRDKLTSARFRHLNETLYTTSSDDALSLFNASPELFNEYHTGFAQQVKESWPQNPVDDYVTNIKARGAMSEIRHGVSPLPRRKTGSCTIADLGCGDAPLARGCQSMIKRLTLKFHSYDLHAPNTLVTKADIAHLPLRDGEADVAVFCLSLMGTNWITFVEEAWRILRGDGKGEVWVAEVKSRFGRVTKGRVVENSVGKRRKVPKPKTTGDHEDYDLPERFAEDARSAEGQDDGTDISAFIKVFTRRGFQLKEGSVNKANKMFVSMVFTKSGIPTTGKHKGLKWNGKEYQRQQEGKVRFVGGQKDSEDITPEEEAKTLKPCVYKTR